MTTPEQSLGDAVSTWKDRNPEKVAEQKARWYHKHKDDIVQRRSAEEARQRKRARDVQWRKENPEYRMISHHNRRALLAGAGGRISPGLVGRLLVLQTGLCPCCREPLGDDYHVDHILPLSLGGTNSDDNIQLLRGTCNRKKHASHPIDYMQSKGFLL